MILDLGVDKAPRLEDSPQEVECNDALFYHVLRGRDSLSEFLLEEVVEKFGMLHTVGRLLISAFLVRLLLQFLDSRL